ncbi:MAG: DUF6179 domain-containing protein [Gordonibacter sp.]|uniref:DUF6179 domain-containing protein n=1 Tax=Gordonibacter sp. TaxID=1968902 RepID=UPI002FC750D4
MPSDAFRPTSDAAAEVVAEAACEAAHKAACAASAESPASLAMPSSAALDGATSADTISAVFQASLWQLLAKQMSLYTLGESSSLPEYDAHRLLSSTCFVLGVDPADLDIAVMRAICAEGFDVAYERNLHAIEREVGCTETLWKEVCLTTPLLESVALKDTLESLRNFKARYVPRFFAHEIPADIDYPLCHPVNEAVEGVRYVNTYLERLIGENRFLQCFDLERCRSVLHAVHPQYGELIVNLFEPVATNAVGCALAEGEVRALRVGPEDCLRIALLLQGCSATQVRRLLSEAASRACDALGLCDGSDGPVRDYVQALAERLVPRVRMALRTDALGGVFLEC